MTDLIIKSESLFLTNETNQIIYVPVSDVIMDTDSSTSFQILGDESTVHVVMQDTLIQEQGSGSFEDAAFDNKTYGRKNGVWVQIPPQTNDAYLYGKVSEFSTFKLNAEGLGIDPNDKLISINNLIDYGLLDNVPKDEITPPIPKGLVVSGTVGGIRLRWIPAHTQYKNHSLTQVWRSQTDSRNTAVKITDVLAHNDFEDSNTTFGVTYYYWIKFVNLQGTVGNFNGLPGTAGTMIDASDSIIDQISNNIRGSELYQDLLTPIGELNAATAGLLTVTAAHAADLVNETSNRNAALLAESAARTAALQEEETARVLAIAVEASLRQQAIADAAQDAAEGLQAEVFARQRAVSDAAEAWAQELLDVTDPIDAALAQEVIDRTTSVSAEATQRGLLATKVMGAGNPNSLTEVSSGLLYETKQSITNLEGSLVQQIALLSVGSNNQFDYAKIWYFDSGVEGWGSGGTNMAAVNGWLRPPTDGSPYCITTLSPNVDGTKYPQIRARIRKVGNPSWEGLLNYLTVPDQTWGINGKTTTTAEPNFDVNGIGNVTWNMSGAWSANQITHFLYRLSVTVDASNYYEVDWIAVGRPSPGASSADLYTEQAARTNADGALSQQIASLSGVVDGKASGSALSALTVRVEDTEDSISSTSSDLTLLKSKLAFAENTLDPSVWVVGTQGSQGAWSVNGHSSESEIVLAGTGTVPLGPLRAVEKLWQCQELGNNDGSGGYNVSPAAANKIDKSIGTVFSAFVRHNGATSGHIYHGCDVYGGIEDLGDTVNWNPYWVHHPCALFTPNKWYLLYGVIQPEGGNTPTGLSGIYDCETGIRIVDVPDFRCSPTWNNVNQVYRNYWYYSGDTTHKVWFAQPRVVPLNQSLSPWQLMSINPLLTGTATALDSLDTRVEATEAGLVIEAGKVTTLQSQMGDKANSTAVESINTRINDLNGVNGRTIEVISAKTISLESTIGNASSGVLHDLAAVTTKVGNLDDQLNLSTGSHSLTNLTSAMNSAAATAANLMRTEIENDPVKGLSVLSADTTLLKNTLNGSNTTAFNALKTSMNEGMAASTEVTALKAQLPGGANLIKSDSEFELTNPDNSAIGWYTISDGSVSLAYKNHAGAGYTPVGFDQIGCNGNGQSPSYIDLRAYSSNGECITVVQGQRYCFSAYTANHRCALVMYIIWYNEAGSYITESTIESPISAGGGTALNAFAFNYVFGTPPAGATRAGLIVRGYRNNGESDPYIWVCQPMFCEVHADATVPPKYSPSLAGPFAAVAKEALARETADDLMASDITNLEIELGMGDGGTAAGTASTGLIAKVTKAKADIGTLPVGVTSLSEAFTNLKSTLGDANSGVIHDLNTVTEDLDGLGATVSTQAAAILALNSQQNITELLPNTSFARWTNAGTIPDDWDTWVTNGILRYTGQYTWGSPYGLLFELSDNVNGGIVKSVYGTENASYLDLELVFTLLAGPIQGAGVYINWVNTVGGYSESYINLGTIYAGNGELQYKRTTLKRRIKRPSLPGTFSHYQVYVMGAWGGFGAMPGKAIVFNYISLKKADASADAIETLETAVNHTSTGLVATANKVLNLESVAVPGVAAQLQSVAATVATLNGAASSYGVKVNVTGGGKTYAAGFAVGASYNSATNTGVSSFGVNADTFFVTNNGSGDVLPFIVDENGIVYMNSAVIGDATISRAKIGELNVTTLDGDTLAFIKANIGTVVTDDIQGDSNILYNLNSTEPVQIGNAVGSVYGTEVGSAQVGWVNIPARTNNRAYGLQFFVQGSVLKDTAGTATITAEFFTANSNAAAGNGVTMPAPFNVTNNGFNCIGVSSDPSDPAPTSWSNFTVGSVAVVYKDANNFIEGIVAHVQYVSETPHANIYVRGTAVSLIEVVKIGSSVPSDGAGCVLYSKSVANRYYKKLGISLSTTINTTSASQVVNYNMSYLDTGAKTTAGVSVLCVLSHVGTGPCTNQSVDFTIVSAR